MHKKCEVWLKPRPKGLAPIIVPDRSKIEPVRYRPGGSLPDMLGGYSVRREGVLETVLVISERPLHREGLKLLVEEAAEMEVVTAPGIARGLELAGGVRPVAVVIESPGVRAADLTAFFEGDGRAEVVIVIDWARNNLFTISRSAIVPAVVSSLMQAITGTVTGDGNTDR